MKALRLYCAFGGKPWPFFVLMIVTILLIRLCKVTSLFTALLLLFLLILSIGGLIALSFLEHRVRPGERELAEKADYPIFGPVTPEVARRVANIEPNYRSLGSALLIVLFLFPVYHGMMIAEDMENDSSAAMLRLIAGLLIAGICAFVLHFIYPVFAKKLTKDAIYTIIPISGYYQINQSRNARRRSGREHFSYYVVFYLPDGRYVLPVKREDTYAENIIIVKNNGFYLWYTDAADNPDSIRLTMLFRP